MIKVYNGVFTPEENLKLYNSILFGKKFTYGEVDSFDTPPTGMVYDMSEDDNLFDKFYAAVLRNHSEIESLSYQRAYVNLFLPHEDPYFHTDGNVITCLFYINPEYNDNEGGETQFLIEDNIVGIKAKPARLVVFDGNIVHRATSFRSNPRLTVALKFIP